MPEAQGEPSGTGEPKGAGAKRREKQAVVIVHGMGEQMPMETLRSFVETMWRRDPGVVPLPDDDAPDAVPVENEVWFKPDSRNDSAELWRITTRHEAKTGQRVDFFEFYWADVTASNTIDHLKDLFLFMLKRRPSQVPPRVLGIWRVLLAATIFFAALSLWQAVGLALGCDVPSWVRVVLTIGGAAYAAAIGFVVAYLGDVARYCRAKPPNIAARRAIRERGLARLRALTGSGEYDRIVLVGHSLGSIVAYDLIKLLWAEWAGANPIAKFNPLFDALVDCHEAGVALKADPGSDIKRDAFRSAQYATFLAAGADPRPDWIKAKDKPGSRHVPWVISDFVSVGAALSHAQFLLAKDETEFRAGVKERRFPSAPPAEDGDYGYVYAAGGDVLRIDHAACFAAVRWTNIHDVSGHLGGDLVSGPVAALFGPGVLDRHVEIRRERGLLSIFPRLFTHTLYWTDTRGTSGGEAPDHLKALRKALDLVRAGSPAGAPPA